MSSELGLGDSSGHAQLPKRWRLNSQVSMQELQQHVLALFQGRGLGSVKLLTLTVPVESHIPGSSDAPVPDLSSRHRQPAVASAPHAGPADIRIRLQPCTNHLWSAYNGPTYRQPGEGHLTGINPWFKPPPRQTADLPEVIARESCFNSLHRGPWATTRGVPAAPLGGRRPRGRASTVTELRWNQACHGSDDRCVATAAPDARSPTMIAGPGW